MKTILLLGSGELGKEFVISLKRYGCKVIAVDSYSDAPAMQVADEREVINMLDADELERIVQVHQPDFIVPEIEAIRTEKLIEFEAQGITVVPSAKAVNYTMDRKAIRDLAAKDLGLKTAKYEYATSEEKLRKAVELIGIPCVVKPLMSSSGKGQSTIKSTEDVGKAWQYANEGARGDKMEVIVEEFIKFDSEITLLTVTQKNGKTLFCPPIGHRQERGDYQESWQPATVQENWLKDAENMAKKVTSELGGNGIWGVEFFLTDEGVYFSELSPRPHDTGMVTLAGTQNFNEFELHARAVLELEIPEIKLERFGANAVILAQKESIEWPRFSGLGKAALFLNSDFKIFGKPTTRPYRRMGIGLTYGKLGSDINALRKKAKEIADCIKVD
ncbi:MAG: formate-dependent phosphoribosylglycinamide formyltransferase [Flavobacteriales bacterium]|nr:formate-dependent phosphoribosylglycinamide formyltransferase [Flavobacteriales bacterium]